MKQELIDYLRMVLGFISFSESIEQRHRDIASEILETNYAATINAIVSRVFSHVVLRTTRFRKASELISKSQIARGIASIAIAPTHLDDATIHHTLVSLEKLGLISYNAPRSKIALRLDSLLTQIRSTGISPENLGRLSVACDCFNASGSNSKQFANYLAGLSNFIDYYRLLRDRDAVDSLMDCIRHLNKVCLFELIASRIFSSILANMLHDDCCEKTIARQQVIDGNLDLLVPPVWFEDHAIKIGLEIIRKSGLMTVDDAKSSIHVTFDMKQIFDAIYQTGVVFLFVPQERTWFRYVSSNILSNLSKGGSKMLEDNVKRAKQKSKSRNRKRALSQFFSDDGTPQPSVVVDAFNSLMRDSEYGSSFIPESCSSRIARSAISSLLEDLHEADWTEAKIKDILAQIIEKWRSLAGKGIPYSGLSADGRYYVIKHEAPRIPSLLFVVSHFREILQFLDLDRQESKVINSNQLPTILNFKRKNTND